jgi:SAM-dependent methyltransferase
MLQTIRKAARGFLQRVRRRGFVHACRWTRHHLYERWRERRLGIDTAGFADWKGSVSRDDCHDYAPLSYACIERALALVEIDAGSDVFLDYGCGKGRAVVVAATLPFRRVIGVDLVDALCEIARRNVKAASRHLRCQDVEIITADATTYVVPEEVSVIYLYNPFWGETLRAVQQRIRESNERSPRRLRIVYLLNPDQIDAFTDCRWLRRTHDISDFWEGVRCAVYEFSDTSVAERPHDSKQRSLIGEQAK